MHIGIDSEKVVISPHRLRMRTGRAVRRRLGSLTEVVPRPASGRSRGTRIRFAALLAFLLLGFSAVLAGLGIAWWMPASASVAAVVVVAVRQARAARVGFLAVPEDEDGHILYAEQERIAFQRAVVIARRIRRTWPELSHMIDPVDADLSLVRALDDLAAVMARRQQIRRLRDELADVDPRNLPAGSPALLALAAQRERVRALWRETGESANRILAGIQAAALAGESLIRERRVGATAREAEQAITRLSAEGAGRSNAAGPDLAERTAAVVSAYRDLSAGR